MIKFIRWNALELYTAISIIFLMIAGITGSPSFTQKIVLLYTVLFVFHEWEEGRYPGGFIDKVVSKVTGLHASEELHRASRIPTGILLLTFSLTPYLFDNQPVFLLVAMNLCIFEGIVHILAIRVANLGVPYSPGMITAELELILGIYVYVRFANLNVLSAANVLLGIALFIACFICMQRSLLAMMGKGYGDILRARKAHHTK
ncbi:HXXEE domain-containing protein [Streptococcus pantholopis]|uniref:HXXEE domain-containing protein n=1 Tax=Streptococcus pantholopis TaxID=1811193 RepID=A0A172Q6S4_9STRE|nr:HXXEE domain-containing protein [Streptococcus pantholopis]AND79112.1 hypothetical protein A0O21_03265 [Streptococcus pantholopis]